MTPLALIRLIIVMKGVVTCNKSIFLYGCFITELFGGDMKPFCFPVTVKHDILNPGSGEAWSNQWLSLSL